MTEAGAKTFAIFLSVDHDNKREAERMVWLRRYLKDGFGPGIKIIDEALLTECRAYPFLVIAEAPSRQVLENTLSPIGGVYLTKIIEACAIDFDPNVPPARFCLFVSDMTEDPDVIANGPQPVPNSISVRARIELPAGSPCSCVWFLNAPMADDAHRYVKSFQPAAFIVTMNAMTAATFFENKFSPHPPEMVELPQSSTAAVAAIDIPADFAITNEGTVPMWVADYDPTSSYVERFNNRFAVAPGATFNFKKNAYVWSLQVDAPTTYTVNRRKSIPRTATLNILTNYPLPLATFAHLENGHIGLNLAEPGSAHSLSDFSTWLHDLLLTNTFDAPWPEDNYSGIDAEVYDYFKRKLPSLPKDGNLSSGFVLNVHNRSPKPFPEKVFHDVKTHLLEVCIYFESAQLWFGTSGIFSAINSEISIAAGPALDAAAGRMSIAQTQTIGLEVLDAIFSDIATVVTLIPGYGPFLSAAIRVSWSIAKVSIDANQPGRTSTAIQATVAQMKEVLIQYLNQQVEAVKAQHKTIKSNWGRLQAFGLAKETGKMSEDRFDVTVTGGGVTVSKDYVQAAADAWSTIFYKSLFAVTGRPTARITFLPGPSANAQNPWNPAEGNYNYRYLLLCTYDNGTNDPNHKGYCVFDCHSTVEPIVLERLFGPAPGGLNIDPNEFFAGFNGWPEVIPYLNWYDEPTGVVDLGVIIKLGW